MANRIQSKPNLESSTRPLWSQWKPTNALPGTAEKMAVMRQRVRDRVPVHHPLDATWQHGCITRGRRFQEDDVKLAKFDAIMDEQLIVEYESQAEEQLAAVQQGIEYRRALGATV